MEASTVTIDKATMAKAQKPLSMKEKRVLKRAGILAYIRNKPAGQLIRMHDMALAAGFTERNAGSVPQFLRAMVRDKLITMEGIPKSKWRHFTVLEDVKTHPLVEQLTPSTETPPTPPQAGASYIGRIRQGIRMGHRQRQLA